MFEVYPGYRICHNGFMSIPVVNTTQMREWENATWAAGQTEAAVIDQVGRRVAGRAAELTRAGDTILFLAGKGHNGDDVRAAAKHLAGRRAELLEMPADTGLPALEAKLAAKPALIVDGLFGIGLDRPLSEPWQKIIAAVNATGIPVLSVDLPSGLHADTGGHFGAVIHATVTLTIGAPKTGLLAPAAMEAVGRLEVADDVGLIPCPFKSELNVILPGDFVGFPPVRKIAGHKGTHGQLTILAGSLGYHGAAVLATRGAQRARPGLISLHTPESVYYPIAAQLQSAMVQVWSPGFNPPDDIDGLLAGPGLAAPNLPAEVRMTIRRSWRVGQHSMVVDASGLDMLAPEPFPKNVIRVMTPHPGEAARLLRIKPEDVQANRVGMLREISKRFAGCWVVLKGFHTLIGRAEGDIFVNLSGNPWLGQGGTGDVLAGYMAGLLTQPDLKANPAKVICHAVWEHGAAADCLHSRCSNWTAEELADEIGNGR